MDVTLHIMIKPATHTLTDIANARRLIKGDIVDVYKATKYATLQEDGNYLLNSPPNHERFGFIHVKNIPDILNRAKIRAKLSERLVTLNVNNGLDNLIRQKKWHVPPSILPTSFKQKLLIDKQITVEWTTAKAYIRKKTTPVLLDAEQDDISTALTDKDVE